MQLSSLPEVVWGAALTASVDDIAGLASHCRRLLTEPDLSEGYRRLGLQQAKMFTTTTFANELTEIYRKAAIRS